MKDVTVLIPTYNHGRFLVYQLESLLRQTSPPKHIVVLDDGSTDETQELLKPYQANRSVTVIRQEQNRGIHAATTLLLTHVQTEFFAFAAADDILAREWCDVMASLLETYKHAKMAVSNSFIYEGGQISVTDAIHQRDGRPQGVYDWRQFLGLLVRNGRVPPSNTIMYRSDIIEGIIRPVLSRTELSVLVDVLLIFAIASRYPVAYSTRPLGVFIRSRESYGNAFFVPDYLKTMIGNIELFLDTNKYIPNRKAKHFVICYVSYSWVKQIVISKLAALSRREDRGLRYAWLLTCCYWELALAFVVAKRFRFVRFGRPSLRPGGLEIETAIDRSVLERLDVA